MKNILILNPCLYTNGGGEKYMGYFCQFLEKNYSDITIDILVYNINGFDVSDSSYIKIEDLNKKFDLALTKVKIIKIYGDYDSSEYRKIILNQKIKSISKRYDIFINWNYLSKQIGCAKKNIYFCMFPPSKYEYSQSKKLARPYRKYIDNSFSNCYRMYVCISKFTQNWLLEYWPEIGKSMCALIYPPVYSSTEIIGDVGCKKNIILSVGRFFLAGHNKKQREMLEFFLENEKDFGEYEYHIAGSVSDDDGDNAYLSSILDLAKNSKRVYVHVNCGLQELQQLYTEAKIFWHATGYGVDEKIHPEQMEHFGITTVEAMSHAVIPVVINSGGQPEIVKEGENGYLWDDFQECIVKTKKLICDEKLRVKMAHEAVKTSFRFSTEQFEIQCRNLFENLER